MSFGTSEQPRQDSQQFQANDQRAKTQGGDKSTKPPTDCPLKWTVKIQVKGEVSQRKPKLESAETEIEWSDSTTDAPTCNSTGDDQAATDPMEGKGARSGKCRAKAKGWYLQAEKDVSLADGDNKTVELVLKPALWIGFKGVDDKSGAVIEALNVKADLTELGEHETTTPKDVALEIEHDALRPGGTCKLEQLSHDTVLYEAVGDVTSE